MTGICGYVRSLAGQSMDHRRSQRRVARKRGRTFSNPKSRSLSGNVGGSDFSSFASKELVGSSKISNFGLLYKALAIVILCTWPPDKLFPFSWTSKLIPFLTLIINFFS